jgi:hypothetical protein
MFTVKCEKCDKPIELKAAPDPKLKLKIFLCNTCQMAWEEIRDKMFGHYYADEIGKAFSSFINSKSYTSHQI